MNIPLCRAEIFHWILRQSL